MNLSDIIVLLLVAAAVGFAVWLMRRPKKSGCCGDCSSCGCSCGGRRIVLEMFSISYNCQNRRLQV